MKYLICNLKANFTLKEILTYKKNLDNYGYTPNLIVCPSFCFLPIIHSKNYLVGAQDVSEYGNGSHTGKVTARMLKSIDVNHVLLNHSELNNKKNKVLAKLKKCLKAKLNVYLFISDSKEEFNYQYTINALLKQINYYLKNIKNEDFKYLSFVYEPSWLVGLNSLKSTEITNIITMLKKELINTYKHSFNILYGGGVNESLIKELANSNIDGFVVGNNSLDVNNIIKILNIDKK